jgi:uncharacterized protein with PQ loop repeat
MSLNIEYVGFVAGSFGVLAVITQLYRIIKLKSAKDISTIALIGGLISTSLWIFYHYVKNDSGPIITSSLLLMFLLIALGLKVYYGDGKTTPLEKGDAN